jgi:hypothetical protein
VGKIKGFKMKIITKFVDEISGDEFDNQDEAIKNEKMNKDILDSFSFFKEVPKEKNCDFENGDWCYQRTEEEFLRYKETLLRMIKKYHKWIDKQYNKDGGLQLKHIGASYMIGRYLNDNDSSLYHHYCIMSDICPFCFRQWGQQYYANNCSHNFEDTRKIK